MAEADDLKSFQCGFESHWGHQFAERLLIVLQSAVFLV
jgi:hypothetical protein